MHMHMHMHMRMHMHMHMHMRMRMHMHMHMRMRTCTCYDGMHMHDCIYASTPALTSPGAAPRGRGALRCVGHAQRPAGGGSPLGLITRHREPARRTRRARVAPLLWAPSER